MQEVWFKDDYESLKNCTASKYQITEFDKECGRLNPVIDFYILYYNIEKYLLDTNLLIQHYTCYGPSMQKVISIMWQV